MAATEAAAEEAAAAVEAAARQYLALHLGPEPPDAEPPDDPIMAAENTQAMISSTLKNTNLAEQKIMQTPEALEMIRLGARVSKLENEVASIADHTSHLRAKKKRPSTGKPTIKEHMVPDLSRVRSNATMSDLVRHNTGAGLSAQLFDICNICGWCMNAQTPYTQTSEHSNSMNISGSFDRFVFINSEHKWRHKTARKLCSGVAHEALSCLKEVKVAVATTRGLVALGEDARNLWMWLFGT